MTKKKKNSVKRKKTSPASSASAPGSAPLGPAGVVVAPESRPSLWSQDATITAVLNGFRRPENLELQLDALAAQTVKASEVLIWHNATDSASIAQNRSTAVTARSVSAYSTKNFGVWARFAFALNARTEYVAVFDDDTIPGARWFENCLATMHEREALLGTIGLRYLDPPPASSPKTSYYMPFEKIGWYPEGQRESAEEVDFVGHAWFFKRAWLSTFWRELPDPNVWLCGEDLHFSAMLQKYLGVPTVVPRHPPGEPRLWGSTSGFEKGNDAQSLWQSNPVDGTQQPFRESMNAWFVKQRRAGWRLLGDARDGR